MEIGNRYFRLAGGYIDIAIIKTSDFKYITFACIYGNSQYKCGPYTWETNDFLREWILYTELNKALL
jgi:hypothetical protein